jgi:hypothetical protein
MTRGMRSEMTKNPTITDNWRLYVIIIIIIIIIIGSTVLGGPWPS